MGRLSTYWQIRPVRGERDEGGKQNSKKEGIGEILRNENDKDLRSDRMEVGLTPKADVNGRI